MNIKKLPSTPSGKIQDVHLGFNKLTKAYCTMAIGDKSKLDTQYYVWRTEKFNPITHQWQGDMNKGKIVSLGEIKPLMTERTLNSHCHQKIKKKYMYYDQINILSKMFKSLIAKGVLDENDDGVADFVEMNEYIDRTLKNNEQWKAKFQASEEHDYISLADEAKNQSQCLHGGLQAIAGRPQYGSPEY